MTENLALGTAVISATVLLHTVGLIAVTHLMSFARVWFRLHKHEFGRTMAMIATVLALFIVHAVEIWLWALVYIAIGSLPDIESALYFSTTTFSTIGYGDIVPLHPYARGLANIEAIIGQLYPATLLARLVTLELAIRRN